MRSLVILALLLPSPLFAQWSDPVNAYMDIMDSNLYPDPPGVLVFKVEKGLGEHEEIGISWNDVLSAEIVLQRPSFDGLIDQITSVWRDKTTWYWGDGLEERLYLDRWHFSDSECAGLLEHANSLVEELQGDVESFAAAPMTYLPSFKPDPIQPDTVMIHGPSFQITFSVGRFKIEARPGYYSQLGFHVRSISNALSECAESVAPEVFPLGR